MAEDRLLSRDRWIGTWASHGILLGVALGNAISTPGQFGPLTALLRSVQKRDSLLGGTVRRFIGSLLIVFIGLWAAGSPSWSISETEELNNTVTGPFDGEQFHIRGGSCPPDQVFQQLFDLIVRPAPDNPHQPRMLGTLHIDTCRDIADQQRYLGTFLFTSPRGATLTGTVTGTTTDEPTGSPFDLTLTVTGATSSFKGVTGKILVSGTWFGPVKAVSGTSTGDLHRPK
jgi:hypothetical protein